MDRPWLLLDVDGALVPFGPASRVEERLQIAPELAVHPRLADWLAQLSQQFELAWATSWEHEANAVLAPLLGLPTLPVVEFRRGGAGTTWKLEDVDAFVGARAVAWVDDELGPDAEAWARERPHPTLLLRTRPSTGLAVTDIRRLEEFAISLTA